MTIGAARAGDFCPGKRGDRTPGSMAAPALAGASGPAHPAFQGTKMDSAGGVRGEGAEAGAGIAVAPGGSFGAATKERAGHSGGGPRATCARGWRGGGLAGARGWRRGGR